MQIRKYKIKFQRINHIFISHLHGDHYLGLLGLLQSMHLLGRRNEMNLYCPIELKEIIEIQNKHSQTQLNYNLNYYPLNFNVSEVIFEDEKVKVESFPLKHRIPTCGFKFSEKTGDRKIIPQKMKEFSISNAEVHKLKKGINAIDDFGKEIPYQLLTEEPNPTRSYAYCSDTTFLPSICQFFSEVDLLYHEATFLQEMEDRAKATFHSTAQQAAQIAKLANVKKLLIGHYSARYFDLKPHLLEASSVFPNTLLANEGEKYQI
jgi:ribonuclease Z